MRNSSGKGEENPQICSSQTSSEPKWHPAVRRIALLLISAVLQHNRKENQVKQQKKEAEIREKSARRVYVR